MHAAPPQADLYARRLLVHGLGAMVSCDLPRLGPALDVLLRPFFVRQANQGFLTCGTLRPYVEAEVLRHLSADACAVPSADPAIEIFRLGERFWIIDPRVGMVRINLLRGHWKSWIMDPCRAGLVETLDRALFWPMAQLLRPRGLHLVPAASIVRQGRGVLLLSPFPIDPEVIRLGRSGWRLISPRWTILRCNPCNVELLHVPALASRPGTPMEFAAAHRLAWRPGAFCDTALLIEPGRRTEARATELSPNDASEALRYAWPIADLRPLPRLASPASALASLCRCFRVQLASDARGLPRLLESILSPAPIVCPRRRLRAPAA